MTRLPKFTAEKALRETNTHYRINSTLGAVVGSRSGRSEIVPSRSRVCQAMINGCDDGVSWCCDRIERYC